MNYAQKVNPWHKNVVDPCHKNVVDPCHKKVEQPALDKDSVKPGWVHIRHGGPKGRYEYTYGPAVFNAYMEDAFQRDLASQYISKRRVWRDQVHIQRMNDTLGDLSPYWQWYGPTNTTTSTTTLGSISCDGDDVDDLVTVSV